VSFPLKRVGLLTGLSLFLVFWLMPVPAGMTSQAQAMAAIAALMASWWMSEAIPIPATALLPIVLYPLLGIMDTGVVTRSYAHHLVFLFLGGFLIALTMQRWGLHRRIAMHIVNRVGTSETRLVLGFMLATAFLSMWISNTATAMLMVTIGIAVLYQIGHTDSSSAKSTGFDTALMLGIAYSASIGGVATLIGTPPNAILAGVAESTLGMQIGFTAWMSFALPLSLIMLLFAWLYLTRVAYQLGHNHSEARAAMIKAELEGLGLMSIAEKRVALVFLSVAVLWIVRGLVDIPLLQQLNDSSIAIAAALLLFVLPSGEADKKSLLDWDTAQKLPWDILLLFGGGFALASGFSETGLTRYLADQLGGLSGLPAWLVIATVCLLVIFLTEVTSNTATASLLLPFMAVLGEATGLEPLMLMVAAALSASFAFMLPVATPPNAIVFASRCISIPQMARAGLWLNILGMLLITGFIFYWLPSFK
jgi:sodium-dependent dicarboxylate transporter 2/3/5